MMRNALTLAVQIVSTWDFSPVGEMLTLCLNGAPCRYTIKKGGYYILTRPFAVPFVLSILSSAYFPYSGDFLLPPPDKILSVQLTPRYPRGADTWLTAHTPLPALTLALGYGYTRLQVLSTAGATVIHTDNPRRRSLEGRSFILRDTRSGNEEAVTLGAALEPALERYQLAALTHGNPAAALQHDYPVASSVLLPAFTVQACDGPIPLNVPPGGPYPLWLYTQEAAPAARLEIARGQTLTV